MSRRYGAQFDNPRVDPGLATESLYARPVRQVGPLRATTPLASNPLFAAVSVGAATSCANAVLEVTGGVHLTASLGVGECPAGATAGRLHLAEDLVFSLAASQIVPGGTSLSLRNNADNADNLIITDAGEVTFRNHIDMNFTADANDEHALELNVDAAAFGDIKAVDIVYTTGALAAGEDEAIILINIDESAASGGDILGFEVLSTTGSGIVHAITTGAGVEAIRQLAGTFGNMDSALVKAVDRLTEFTSTGSDIQMFVADNDTITIGDAAKFEELEFLLAIVASGAGIAPTFEFSTGVGTWGTFSPVDGTNGMRNSGIIAWDDADIPSWAVGTGSEYLIRITRTRNTLSTPPTEDLVQIAAVTVYSWDKSGDLIVNDITMTDLTVLGPGPHQIGSGANNIDTFLVGGEASGRTVDLWTSKSTSTASTSAYTLIRASVTQVDPSAILSTLGFWTNAGDSITEKLLLGASGGVYINDSANANMTVGLTINQAANDNQILTAKSSDVGSGLTSALRGSIDVEVDDWFTAFKTVAGTSGGGATLVSVMEDVAEGTALSLESYGGTATTTKSTAGRALVEVYVTEHDNSNALVNIAADGNVFGVRARRGGADVSLMLVDEDGDLWVGGGVGFYGTAPVSQGTVDDLTDTTGGVQDGTLVAIPAVNGSGATTAQEAAIDNNFIDVFTALQDVIDTLQSYGLIA